MLQLDDRLGVPEMLLAVEPELILAAEIEFERAGLGGSKPARCRAKRLAGDHVQAAALDSRRRAGEVSVDHRRGSSPTASNCWAAW